MTALRDWFPHLELARFISSTLLRLILAAILGGIIGLAIIFIYLWNS